MTIENQSFEEQDEITQQAETFHPADDSQNRTVEEPQSDFSEAAEADAPAEKKEKRETPDNSGSLFKNDRKTKEAHPDVTGSVMIFGQEFYVSGWRKAGAKGDFYSLSFRVKDLAAKPTDLI
ncbi:MAG: hypothetical protein Q8J66_00910 [Methylotenera sp.]|nr:hypothetical protein [Methylotenera sp.]